MMRILIVLFALCALIPLHAQDTPAPDLCSPEDIAARVEAASAAYEADSSTQANPASALSPVSALSALAELRAELDAIYAECDALRIAQEKADAESILNLLREGGYVVYMRHGVTNRMEEDASLESCETQRNLNEQGRADSARIGEMLPALEIPIGKLISTEYCRTQETARLAFGADAGEPQIIPRAELEDRLLTLLSEAPADGTNTVIVAHVGSIGSAMTIPDTFNEGDALVFAPDGAPSGEGETEFIARIPLAYWEYFAEIAVAEGEK